MMFAAVFALAFVTTYAAELPSYINVCGRKNPNLDQCIVDNINNLKGARICHGLSELNIPSIEPFNVDKLILSDTANSKIYLNAVQISGFCNFTINSVHADLDKLKFNLDLSFYQLYLNATYDIDIRIVVPIVYKAPIYFTSENVDLKASLQAGTITKRDETIMYVSEIKTNIDIKRYDAKYDLEENELNQLDQILGGLVDSNQEEFIERLTSPLEKAVSIYLVSLFNGLFKKFTYDELFPDRT